MDSIRDIRQNEFANTYLKSNGKCILYLCPRFGKINTTIKILEKAFKPNCNILIAYPDNKIKNSWEEEFDLRGYNNKNITYTTYLSLKKCVDNIYDLIIFDEIHLLSEAQIGVAKRIIENNEAVLGLTGTMNEWTEKELTKRLHLPVLARYSIEQAINEGVIVDYEITVKLVSLDNNLNSQPIVM